MTELVPVDTGIILSLPLEDKSTLEVSLSSVASPDVAFLSTWLHGKASKTQRAYASDMARFYAVVGKPLREVTLMDFQQFINTLNDFQPTTRKRMIASIKSALSFGVKSGYLTFNVGAVVKLPQVEDKLAERILSERNVERIIFLEPDRRNAVLLSLLYYAGLRAAELCSLQWRHLKERGDAGQVSIFGKGKKTRHVLLDKTTWQEVMSLKREGAGKQDYVFESRQSQGRYKKDRRLDESSIHRIIRKAAERAGLDENVSPHWMRHAHATYSIEHGAPLTLVQQTLGHKSIQTTTKYIHVRPGDSSTRFLRER